MPRPPGSRRRRTSRRSRSCSPEPARALAALDRRQSDAWCAGLAGTSAITLSPLRHSMLAAAGAEAVLGPPPDEIPDETAACLIFMLGSSRPWEALAVQWAFGLDGGPRSIGATARRTRDGDRGLSQVDLLILGCGPRHDPERIESAIRLVKALAARAPRAERAPVLALLAWFNWAFAAHEHDDEHDDADDDDVLRGINY